jgi:hypothetical protein
MSEKINVTKCKGCGLPIFFKDGTPWYAKKVPVLIEIDYQTLQPAAAGGPKFKRTKAYVSHFVNCPDASRFSGGNKRKEDSKDGIRNENY